MQVLLNIYVLHIYYHRQRFNRTHLIDQQLHNLLLNVQLVYLDNTFSGVTETFETYILKIVKFM